MVGTAVQGVCERVWQGAEAVEVDLEPAHAIDNCIARLSDIANRASYGRRKTFECVPLLLDSRVKLIFAALRNSSLPKAIRHNLLDNGFLDTVEFGPVARVMSGMGMTNVQESEHMFCFKEKQTYIRIRTFTPNIPEKLQKAWKDYGKGITPQAIGRLESW